MLEPVAEEKGIVFVELAVVEHQEKLGAVRPEPLDGMGNTRRETPQVAYADIVDEISSLRIDRGDPRRAVEHVGPFGGLVPMQLAHAAGVQTHVHASDVLGNAKLAHRDLPGPAARLEPDVGVLERKTQVREGTVVGRRRREQVRVLTRPDGILRTGVAAAGPGTAGLRHRFAALRGGGRRCRHTPAAAAAR